MGKRLIPRPTIMTEVKNYSMITLGLLIYAFAWNFFMSPFELVAGGITGVGAIVQYSTNGAIPMQYTYFAINVVLLIIAIWQLGLKFCIKTIYAIIAMTLFLELSQYVFEIYPNAIEVLGPDKKLEASIVGSIFTGMGIAFCFLNNGSTGGVDIIAAIVNKYKDVSFGRAMLYVDVCIITSSFFIIPNESIQMSVQNVFYGYVCLVIINVTLDYMVNSNRQTVQVFIFSNKYDEIAYYITRYLNRGVTLLDSVGYYSGKEGKVVMTLARASQSNQLFMAIKQIDPNALISQSKVMAVYGNGFDKIKGKAKAIKLENKESVETENK
ncbi:MAG: YitT family protein [Bacteroidaceae bacterium]|nr:YitT family protein [Bacteroidaceae bacterium]